MFCPVAESVLERTQYESINVQRCPSCFGHLVDRKRTTGVRAQREKSVAELMLEAQQEIQPDTTQSVRCPRCRRRMEKTKTRWTLEFQLDACRECDLMWFDGGEMALMQLSYESSEFGLDAAERRDRLRNLPPQEQLELQQKIANLPEPETGLTMFLDTLRRENRL